MNRVLGNYTGVISLCVNILTILVVVGGIITGFFSIRDKDIDTVTSIRIEQKVQAARFEALAARFEALAAEQTALAVEARHGFAQFGIDLGDLKTAVGIAKGIRQK